MLLVSHNKTLPFYPRTVTLLNILKFHWLGCMMCMWKKISLVCLFVMIRVFVLYIMYNAVLLWLKTLP